jgi:hypothetical protein
LPHDNNGGGDQPAADQPAAFEPGQFGAVHHRSLDEQPGGEGPLNQIEVDRGFLEAQPATS